MKRLIDSLLKSRRHTPGVYQSRPICRVPEPPIGFVRRSDPNYYFLARKF
jgi:hypothetical protein